MTDSVSAPLSSAPEANGAPPPTQPLPATPEPSDASAERDASSYDAEVRQLRAEAKRHRLAQRAAEQERDTLRTRVDAHDRREVERIAGDSLTNPSDLWLTTNISDLRDDDGEIDRERVSERVEQLLSERPHWRKAQGPPANFSSGVRQPIRKPATLGEAFKRSIGR